MNVLYLLIPLALLLAGAAVVAFGWAVRSGQFDDVDTPALRVLLDDEAPPAPERGADSDNHQPPASRHA